MIEKIILMGLCVVIAYLTIELLQEKKVLARARAYIDRKNEKYYENLLKYYEKNKKLKIKEKLHYFHKINILIDRCGLRRGILINPVTMILTGTLCVSVAYMISFHFFRLILLSCIISLPFFFLPLFVLRQFAENREEKVEKSFLHFLLQLKNHTQIHNDIVVAMREVKVLEPLNSDVQKFLIELASGIKFEKAIENWKEKVTIHQMKHFLENISHCYLYGGNFSELMDKSYHMMSEIQKEKARRNEETKSARMVLWILILLDGFVYGTFIKSDSTNERIMCQSLIGNLILYWNFGSMWLLVLLANQVKKLDY